jgi:hypothetical protein
VHVVEKGWWSPGRAGCIHAEEWAGQEEEGMGAVWEGALCGNSKALCGTGACRTCIGRIVQLCRCTVLQLPHFGSAGVQLVIALQAGRQGVCRAGVICALLYVFNWFLDASAFRLGRASVPRGPVHRLRTICMHEVRVWADACTWTHCCDC